MCLIMLVAVMMQHSSMELISPACVTRSYHFTKLNFVSQSAWESLNHSCCTKITDLMFSSVAWTPRPGEVDKILTVECTYCIKKLYKSEPNLIKVMEKETLNSEKLLQISDLTFFYYSWYFSFKQWLFSMKVSNYESQKFWLLSASTEEFSSHLSLITT